VSYVIVVQIYENDIKTFWMVTVMHLVICWARSDPNLNNTGKAITFKLSGSIF